MGAGLSLAGGSALADTGQTQANVAVASSITLSSLTPSFTLSGSPGATVSTNGAVTMNVKTNNFLGYNVTVQAAAANLTSANASNTATIPVAALGVRKTGDTLFEPVSNLAAVPVHVKASASIEAGDSLSNDYRIVIPFVPGDTYRVNLNYVATAL